MRSAPSQPLHTDKRQSSEVAKERCRLMDTYVLSREVYLDPINSGDGRWAMGDGQWAVGGG